MDRLDLPALALHFALLSLMAIGGVSSILPDMQRYVVEVNHWMSGKQFADAYALAQAAPGPNMMFVTLLGWQLAGWAGAIVATLAIVGPPILLTMGVTRLNARNPDTPLGRAIRGGLGPIAIGLTLSSGWILARSSDHDWPAGALTLLTVALMLRTRLNPVWLILAGAIAGMTGII
ncbi:MAG: chromate transporter [Betaproteobacteria bacterium RIFCSPLOWO2_12_FULL_62_13b]|nr:MAG: chromate transporter [Betaproteobacteria bacterium RIFCSPLOWO2_12_FULL_62_13b]